MGFLPGLLQGSVESAFFMLFYMNVAAGAGNMRVGMQEQRIPAGVDGGLLLQCSGYLRFYVQHILDGSPLNAWKCNGDFFGHFRRQ